MDVKNKTVSTRILKTRYHHALKSGLDSEYILRYTGISKSDVNDGNGRITFPTYLRFNRLLKQHGLSVIDEGIWDISIESMLKDYGSLIALCINQNDVGNALDCFLRYRRLIGDSDYILCAREEDKVIIQYVGESFSTLTPEVTAASALANFIILVNILRFYSGPESKDYDVRFTYTPIFETKRYNDFFGGDISFSENANALIFDAQQLEQQNPSCNSALRPFLISLVEEDMAILQGNGVFSDIVKGKLLLLDDKLGLGVSTAICEQLGISRWTLRRKLAQEGYTFQSLLAEVRLEKAKHYLLEGRLKLVAISELLGFSSQSAFSRFFQKHERISPADYRKQNTLVFSRPVDDFRLDN